ncbi:MAG: hypothetical protein CMO55_11285 [Verrucomicrobiales bacterium]|nr:hypothetical protein [Verrucomicrobiales bacterium]
MVSIGKIHLASLLTALFLFTGIARGQEVTSAASFIAMQCSVSSGYPADGYLSYAEGLVQTITALSPEAQARVLGYDLSTHDAVNKNGKTNSSGGNGSNTTIDPEDEPTLLDRLMDIVGL